MRYSSQHQQHLEAIFRKESPFLGDPQGSYTRIQSGKTDKNFRLRLSRAGFKPQLDIAPSAAQAPKRTGGLADVYLIGWANEPMLDSYSILLQMIKTKTDKAGVFNWGGWSYPEIDKLIEEASTEMDRTKRLELQTKALQMAKDDIIMLPLHQQPMAWVMSKKIETVAQLADNKVRHWLTRFAQ